MPIKEKGPRPEKVQEIDELKEILSGSTSTIIADYRGLNVKSMSTLRKRLRENDAGIRVVKNTLLKRAASGLPAETLVSDLEGPTALKIKGGITDGHIMRPEQITALSTMPPRQVLIAQVVGGLQGPVASFVQTLQQLYGGLVYTLQGVADKKQ